MSNSPRHIQRNKISMAWWNRGGKGENGRGQITQGARGHVRESGPDSWALEVTRKVWIFCNPLECHFLTCLLPSRLDSQGIQKLFSVSSLSLLCSHTNPIAITPIIRLSIISRPSISTGGERHTTGCLSDLWDGKGASVITLAAERGVVVEESNIGTIPDLNRISFNLPSEPNSLHVFLVNLHRKAVRPNGQRRTEFIRESIFILNTENEKNRENY